MESVEFYFPQNLFGLVLAAYKHFFIFHALQKSTSNKNNNNNNNSLILVLIIKQAFFEGDGVSFNEAANK